MQKLILLGIILMIGISFTGCLQEGLTEEEVRNIVREEVTNQLNTGQLRSIMVEQVTKELDNLDVLVRKEVNAQLLNIGDIVEQEIILQLAAIDLNNIVRLEVNSQMTNVYSAIEEEVNRTLRDIDTLSISQLQIVNSDGKLAAMLSVDGYGQGFLGIYSADNIVSSLGAHTDGNGGINIYNKYGNRVAYMGASTDKSAGLIILENPGGTRSFQAGN